MPPDRPLRVKFWGTRGSIPVAMTSAEVRRKLIAALMRASGRRFETPEQAAAFLERELDFAKRRTLFADIQRIHAEDLPVLPLFFRVDPFVIPKQLKGVDAGTVTFDLDSGLKDLRAMLAEGRSRGIELPLVERSIACYEEASRSGLGLTEVSAVSAYWAKRKAP